MDGKCMCGCGGMTPIADRNDKRFGWIAGKHKRFIHNHHARKSAVEYTIEPSGCWIWRRATGNDGYGMAWVPGGKGIHVYAHRMVYERFNGPVPNGLTLDHLCRNRSCVNPDHLEPVRFIENIRRRPSNKLNSEKAEQIRNALVRGESPSVLAASYGVSRQSIYLVGKGRIWNQSI